MLEGIIVGAVGALGGTALLHRLLFFGTRVRDESTVRDRGRGHESTMVDRVHDGRPRSHRDQVAPDRGPGIAAASRRGPARAQCFLPPADHAERFIYWLILDEDGVAHTVVMSDESLFKKYLLWAERFGVVALSEKTLQTLLGKRKPQVVKDRAIRKCPETGRALYLPSGSPDRWTRYTIKPPRREPVRPGTVPVVAADVVRREPEMQPLARKMNAPAQHRTIADVARENDRLTGIAA